MEDLFDISNLQIVGTTVTEFLIGLLLTGILSILIKNIYLSFSNSVSNKSIIANIFPLFSVSIFLIVITIKSSIVLSLGLVGALSIIRFRTAIKNTIDIDWLEPKRKKIADKWYVSGGYLGAYGDIVVDDVDNPQYEYGVANGRGDFIGR